MQDPHQVLLKAAATLYAFGENGLAADLRQLARDRTPAEYTELVEPESFTAAAPATGREVSASDEGAPSFTHPPI